ncbi:hypothetical protein [Tomitella biformata]|uniref:hypothetical protein n=1 Tax=Tomitella biformata TaxID=630403 RepID=UPI000464A219|nr:hypothetical protein [Tomitella biformata]
MRSNYAGVVGYVFLVLGFALGGMAIVGIASTSYMWGIIAAIIAVVCFALAGVILVGISKREHHDPLEPVMTDEGISRYEHRRADGEV